MPKYIIACYTSASQEVEIHLLEGKTPWEAWEKELLKDMQPKIIVEELKAWANVIKGKGDFYYDLKAMLFDPITLELQPVDVVPPW